MRGSSFVHGLAVVLAATDLLTGSAHAAPTVYVDDPLTGAPHGARAEVGAGVRGGTFGESGWTTSGDLDTVWFTVPATLPRGRLEVSVRGLSLDTNLTGEEHDIIALYGATDREEPVGYNPWFRNNTFKILVRIFGTANVCAGCQGVGASKLELALCPAAGPGYLEGACPAACAAQGYDFWQAYLAGGRDARLDWDPSATYRLVVSWEPGRMCYARDGDEHCLGYPGTYAPRALRVRLGAPSSERGPQSAMPHGVTFSNLRFEGEPGLATAACDGAAAGCDAAQPQIRVVDFAPVSGSGARATFRAGLSHCQGVNAFRVAQLWVGERVDAAVPRFAAGWEGGRFYVDDGSQSCAAGDGRVLVGENGTLDCAAATAGGAGNDGFVEWPVTFDAARFHGAFKVFVDAKGPAGGDEPRLGWTEVGTWTVDAPAGSGAPDAGAGGDGGATGRDAGGARDGGAAADGGTARPDAGRRDGGSGAGTGGGTGTGVIGEPPIDPSAGPAPGGRDGGSGAAAADDGGGGGCASAGRAHDAPGALAGLALVLAAVAIGRSGRRRRG